MKTLLSALLVLAMLSPVCADTVLQSSSFSLGYGFTVNGWDTSETSSSNTATTLGDFSFVPTVAGGQDSGGGPTFVNRVLGSTNLGAQNNAYVGNDETFSASITGSWNGSTPSDAAADPNYRTTVNITGIQIWAHSWDADPAPYSLWFHESTAGNTGDSASIVPLHGSGNVQFATDFNQLVWDPGALLVTGTSCTRTFSVAEPVGASSEIPVDGFEVFGTVSLTYASVTPEPSVLVLLATGLLGLLAYAWRKRR